MYGLDSSVGHYQNKLHYKNISKGPCCHLSTNGYLAYLLADTYTSENALRCRV